MNRIRVGVVGAGSWAVAAHLPTLAARPDVELVGVCRPGPLLDRVAARFDIPVASEDYRDILALDLDACVVASPSGLHHEHARAALEAGAHVLCEKPMTIRAADAWDLVRTASRVDRELLVSFGWNYSTMVRRAVELIAGRIGPVEQLSVHMESSTRKLLSNTGAYPQSDPEAVPEAATWTDPTRSGGGYGQAQLSHALALALALAPDERVQSAYAVAASPLSAPVELHAAYALTFAGGAVGTVAGGSSHTGARDDKHQLDVHGIGRDGQFIVDLHRELVWVRDRHGETTLNLPVEAGRYRIDGPAQALADVAGGDRTANRAPGTLGARTVEVLELAYRSLATGHVAERSAEDDWD